MFAKELTENSLLTNAYDAEPYVNQKSSHRVKQRVVSMRSDPNEFSSSEESTDESDARKVRPAFRRRTSRSKQFTESLKLAKRARVCLKQIHTVHDYKKVFEIDHDGKVRLVEIGETINCNCTFASKRDLCLHAVWVLMNVLHVKEDEETLQQKVHNRATIMSLFKQMDKGRSSQAVTSTSNQHHLQYQKNSALLQPSTSSSNTCQERSNRPTLGNISNLWQHSTQSPSTMTSNQYNLSGNYSERQSGTARLRPISNVAAEQEVTQTASTNRRYYPTSNSLMSMNINTWTPQVSNQQIGQENLCNFPSNIFNSNQQSLGGSIIQQPPFTSTTILHEQSQQQPLTCRPSSFNVSQQPAQLPAGVYSQRYRQPWHNSNPFVLMNLTNKVKKCAGCPYPFRDPSGPPFLALVVQHKERDTFVDANGIQRVSNEANRYYHCHWECLKAKHSYISTAMIQKDPSLMLDNFQKASLLRLFGPEF